MIRKGLTVLFSLAVIMVLCAFLFPEKTGADSPSVSEGASYRAQTIWEDQKIKVYLTGENRIREIPLEEYTAGVVAAEMPDSYEKEALRAQAVAARTFALFKSKMYSGEGCLSHKGADVYSSSGCCQGYTEPDKKQNSGAIKASEDTKGVIALFNAHPIRALYHASSGGHTENAENVYSQALAYLRGVPSPGEEAYSRFRTEQKMTISDLRNAFSENPDVIFLDTIPLFDQIEILSRSETGRVTEVRVGLTGMSGSDFRRALGLKSALFDMDFPENDVVFTSTGYGHGVGMSQTGANAMAKNGGSYEEILTHYYTDIEISTLEDWLKSG